MSDQKSLAGIRTRWAAIGAAIAVTIGAGTITTVGAVTSSGERSIYNPITACRLLDTRPEFQVGQRSTPVSTDQTITVAARGAAGQCGANDLPADATALALNVTALNATLPTFLTFWPSGNLPNSSSMNPAPGQPPTPNAVTVPLSASGSFNLYNLQGQVDVLVDVVGYYTDHNHDDRYVLAYPDELQVPLAYGQAGRSGEWFFTGLGWEREAGSDDCFAVPVDVAGGRTVEDVSVLYIATSGPVTLEVNLLGLAFEAGPIVNIADIYRRQIVREISLPATAADTIAEVTFTDDPAKLPQAPATTTAENGSTLVTLCSDDKVQILGVTLNF